MKKLGRRDFIKGVTAGVAATSAGMGHLAFSEKSSPQQRSGYDKPPNIILIYADDLGYGDLSTYGHPAIKTPNIDRLGEEGVRFTEFYVTCPVCTPSRASLLTGRYQARSGLYRVIWPESYGYQGWNTGISHYELTLAEMLKPSGYATQIIGKWHLGNLPQFHPQKHGFDHFLGLLHSNDMDPVYLFRDEKILFDGENLMDNPKQGELGKIYTEEAKKFIGENKNRPFFLYFPHTYPHKPLYVPDEFRGKSKAGIYGDVIEYFDWSVGEIVKTVDELGLAEETLIIFTSDNGPYMPTSTPESPGGLRGSKSTLWDGGIKVPMLARWRGRIPAGSVCDDVAVTMDLFTTIINIAGGTIPQDRHIDGKDIMPLLDGTGAVLHEELFFFQQELLGSARFGKWKIHVGEVRRRGQRSSRRVSPENPELYDLENDPAENKNVAEQHPELVKKFANRIKEFLKEIEAEKASRS